MARIKIQISKKQAKALEALRDKIHTEIFYGGGAGGGKSFIGCYWIITSLLKYPGTRYLIGRAKLKSLKESTLLTFFEILGIFGLKKGKDYNYNSIEGVFRFTNGSSVYLKDLFLYPSDPEFDSLGSTEYTYGFMDEVSEITEKAKMIVMSRLRYKLLKYNLIPKLLMASNPAKNFAYREYWKPSIEGKLKPYRMFISALVGDNPFMPAVYAENLKKMDERSKQRLLYGNWEYDEDPNKLFYYDSIIDIFTINPEDKKISYCVVDVAGKGRDRTIITIWQGLYITKVINKNNISNEELQEILDKHHIPRSHCAIDEDGVGFGLVKDMPGVKGFVNGSSPIQPRVKKHKEITWNYKNLKAQCWFELADRVNEGLIGCYKEIDPMDKKHLIEDLEQIKEKNTENDIKKQIIPKDEIKESLGRSTDIGDTLMMRMLFELRTPIRTIA